jgi:hypothetical protein
VAEGWRRLHNEELYILYTLPNIRVIKLRRMRLSGHVAHMVEVTIRYKILVVNREGKRPRGTPIRRW